MKLYIANKNYSSWSLRPWVLMRTLDIEFEEILKPFPMGGGPTGFDAFSPRGKVPVLVDQEHTVCYYHQLERERIHLLLIDDAKRGLEEIVAGRTQGADAALAQIQQRLKPFAKKSSTAK